MKVDVLEWLAIYGILTVLSIGVIYIVIPWGAKLIMRNRFLRSVKGGSVVFLTFDDGPSPNATPRIIELLKKTKATATFFVLGKNVERYPEIVESIVANGHELGEHSFAHLHAWRSGPIKTLKDLVRGGRSLAALSPDRRGAESFRPPFGKLNGVSLLYIWMLNKKVAFWNVDPRDYCATSAQAVANHVIQRLRKGSVILLHDGRYLDTDNTGVTVDALEMILEACREKGLRVSSLRDGVSSLSASQLETDHTQ
jgi:peptidoglycan-N-acetylglucosamine deacetylase